MRHTSILTACDHCNTKIPKAQYGYINYDFIKYVKLFKHIPNLFTF